ncbi:MAG TPA: OPT family oligopeptide transporter [Casimicrobiaceae bacterium]|nr:OPT family oligopeptide transporter [Casimicrobiaceae bacterium]
MPNHAATLPIAKGAEDAAVAPELVPLPPGATPSEKDRHWYSSVYRGDHVPQLTLRAVAMGAVLGMLMSVSNLYTTMKVGWSFGVAITSCVLSFVLWNLFRGVSAGRLTPMSILENNCMQSTASAAGASTGASIATAFGALLILDPTHRHQPWWIITSFTLATGLMGVFMAIPLKRQMINHEQLPFPSGIAAATTLRSLYSRSHEALRKAYALVTALVAGAIVGVLNTAEEQFAALGRFFVWMRTNLVSVHLPEQIPEHGIMQIAGKPVVGFAFEPSVLLTGAGMIIGMRVSLSMLAASAALYFWIAPWLQSIDAQNAGVPGYVASIPLVGGGTIFHAVRWALWGGTAVMVFSSLTSLALQWDTVVRSFTVFRRGTTSRSTSDIDRAMAKIEVPTSWLIAGLVPISIAMLAIQIIAFGISWWAGVVAVAMSFVLAMVACRATGETDTTPVGPMGKVMQLLFALISPPSAVGLQASITHNLMSAGITANSAASSADLLTDLKSGYLLGANPRRQFLAQFIGVFFGTLVIVPAWYLMIPDQAALEKYPLPATQTWVAVARVLSGGLESLPMSARYAILFGALIGVLIPVLENLAPNARRWLPSAMGLGLGWVVFFSNALAFAVGATIVWIWRRIAPKNEEIYSVPVASGLIAGESLMKAILAMLVTAIGLASAGG